MSLLTGFLRGFQSTAAANREQARRDAEQAISRDGRIFEALIQHEDPEIANLAVQGLMGLGSEKYQAGKGLQRFLGGGVQRNPDIDALLDAMRGLGADGQPTGQQIAAADTIAEAPVDAAQAADVEARPGAAAMPPPPRDGGISPQAATPPPQAQPAQPAATLSHEPSAPMGQVGGAPPTAGMVAPGSAAAGSPPPMQGVEGAQTAGQPPLAGPLPTLAGTPPPQPPHPGMIHQTRPPRRPDTTTHRFWPTEAELEERQYTARERAKVLGEIQGLVAAGYSEDEARELVRQTYARRMGGGTSGFQSVPGQLPDGTPAFGVFDRQRGVYINPEDGEPLVGFQPRQTTGSVSMGADREAAANRLFGRRYGQLSPEEAAQADAAALAFTEQRSAAATGGRMDAAASGPLSSQQQFQAVSQLSGEWEKAEASRREMARQYQLMQTGLRRFNEGDRIGGSQAVLVTFQKILDPDSVVRESEYERSPSGLPLFSRLGEMYNRYIGQWDPQQQRWIGGGAGVPAAELQAMTETARQFLAGMDQWNAQKREQVRRRAELGGIDPGLIFVDQPMGTGAGGTTSAAGAAAPAAAGARPTPTLTPPDDDTPPGAPAVGQPVGNEWPGARRVLPNGEVWAQDAQGNPVGKLTVIGGKFFLE